MRGTRVSPRGVPTSQCFNSTGPAGWQIGLLAVLLALPFLVLPAGAQTNHDNDTVKSAAKPRFQVVDGDTMRFNTQLVRLLGIDAPDKGQTCDDGQWSPAPLAKKALEDFIAGRPVNCRQVEMDEKGGMPIVQCHAGEDDLQSMMVAAGWAWTVGRYGERYEPEQKEAIAKKAGVHGHRCLPPWEWRAQPRGKSTAKATKDTAKEKDREPSR